MKDKGQDELKENVMREIRNERLEMKFKMTKKLSNVIRYNWEDMISTNKKDMKGKPQNI